MINHVNHADRAAKAKATPGISRDRSQHVREAVRALRTGLGETQSQFAARLGVGIATAVRYELSAAPRGKMLVKLARIAHEKKFPDQARMFESALRQDLGMGMIGLPIGNLDVYPREVRRNPRRPLCRPEELPQVYTEHVRSLTRSGARTITSIGLYFEMSDGKRIVVDVALPEN